MLAESERASERNIDDDQGASVSKPACCRLGTNTDSASLKSKHFHHASTYA
jgi:hypothetical protein